MKAISLTARARLIEERSNCCVLLDKARSRNDAVTVDLYDKRLLHEIEPAIKAFDWKLEDALRAVNGKATSFAVTSARTVVEIAERAEMELEANGVPKALRAGASVTYCPAGPAANAYKYRATSTQISLVRNTAGWSLVNIKRTEVYPRAPERYGLRITDKAAAYIAQKLMSRFGRAYVPSAQVAA